MLGTALWTAFLAGLGYLLQEQYQAAAAWVNPISNVVVGALMLVSVYRVVTFRAQEPLAGRGTR